MYSVTSFSPVLERLKLDLPLRKLSEVSLGEAVSLLDGVDSEEEGGAVVLSLDVVVLVLVVSPPPPLPASATLSTVTDTVWVPLMLFTVSFANTVTVSVPSAIIAVLMLTFQVPELFDAVLLNGLVPLPNWKRTVFTEVRVSVIVALKDCVPLSVAPAAGLVRFTLGGVLSTVKLMN